MDDQYYDIQTKKVMTLRERVGGDVVFDHGRMSEQIFDQQLERGVLVRYTPQARTPAHEAHETPFLNAMVMSGLAVGAFGKLFGRNKPPRLNSPVIQANDPRLKSDMDAQAIGRRRLVTKDFIEQARRFQTHLPPGFHSFLESEMDAYMRTERGKEFTFRGGKWMSQIQGLYKHLVSKRPEHKDDLTNFFRAFIGDTHLSRFQTKAPQGVIDSVLRAGNAFTGDYARRDFAAALTPLMRNRIAILQEIGSSDKASAEAMRTYEQIFDSRLRSQELNGEMGRLRAEIDLATKKLTGARDVDKAAAQATLESLRGDMNKVKLLHEEVIRGQKGLTGGESYARMRHSLATLDRSNPRFAQLRSHLEDLDQLVEGMLSFDQEGLRETSAHFRTFSTMASRYVLGGGPDLLDLEAGLVGHNRALARDVFGQEMIERVQHTRAKEGSYDRGGRGSVEGAEEIDSLQREFVDSLEERQRSHMEALQGKQSDEVQRLKLTENRPLHLRSNRPIDRRVVDTQIGQEIIDPKTGERMMVLGSVGDKLQVARMGRTSLTEPKGSLGALAHTSEANAQAIKDTLQQFINRSDDPVARESLLRLSRVLTDGNALESELEPFLAKVMDEANLKKLTKEEIRELSPKDRENYYRNLSWKKTSSNALGMEAREEAMARMFDDIGLKLRGEQTKSPFGMRDLLHRATDAAGAAIDEYIPMGSSLYTVLRQGIPQVAMDQKGVGSASDMLRRILPRSRYKQGGGYSVILSNHPMSHALIETLQKHDVDLKGAVSRDFSKLLGATQNMDDHGVVKQVQAHLGRMFAGRNSRLEKALGSETTGFDLASDVLKWFHQNQVSHVQELSLEAPIEGTEGLFRRDTLAAPDHLKKTLYQTYADDMGALTGERNRLQSDSKVIEDLLKNRKSKRARWQNLLKSPAQRMASLTGQIRALDEPLVKMRREIDLLRENMAHQQGRLSDLDEQIDNASRGHTEKTPKQFLEKAERLRAERARIEGHVQSATKKARKEMAVLTQRLRLAEKQAKRARERFEGSLSSVRNTVQDLKARMERHEERYVNLVERKDALDMQLTDVNAAIKEGGLPLDERVAGFQRERQALIDRLQHLQSNKGSKEEIAHVKALLNAKGLTASEQKVLRGQIKNAREVAKALERYPDDPLAQGVLKEANAERKMLEGFLGDPRTLAKHLAESDARKGIEDVVGALRAGGAPMSQEASERLRAGLAANPDYIDAIMTGNVTLRDQKEGALSPEILKGNRKRVRYLQSVLRGDPYLAQNPHAGYLLESTARAAQKLNEADAVGRAFVLDIESAGSNRGEILHFNGQPMRPVVTEFAVGEASIQDLMGMGRQGFATLRANQALRKTEIFVKPTQQVHDFMFAMLQRGQLAGAEKEQMNFLGKRYAAAAIREQAGSVKKGTESVFRDRVGILAISPEDTVALQKTQGLNFFVYEDDKGKTSYAYVQHAATEKGYQKGAVTQVLADGKGSRARREVLHEAAGIQFEKGGFSMNAQVMSQGQLNNYMRQLNTRLQGKENVVIANNAMLHDLPILLSLMNKNLDLQNDALMRGKVMDFLGGAQYFDISTAMRGLGLGSGNVQDALRKYMGTGVEQTHRALEDVIHEAFVGVRLADDLVKNQAIHELRVGQHLFDTKTGRMIRIDALQSNQGEITGIAGRSMASPWSESMPIPKESFVQDLVTKVDGVATKQNVEMVRPLMATVSDRFRVVDRLDQLTSNQQATAIEKEMQRLMDPRYLERTSEQIAAGAWGAPEFMRPLEDFLTRTRRMGLPAETQSLLLAAAARQETQTVHRIAANPLKYAAYMSRDLTGALKRIAPAGKFEALASIVMRSAGRELDEDMLAHMDGLNLEGFAADVRAALVGGNMGSELYGLGGGGHFMSAKTVPFKEMLLLGDGNGDLTPAQLARALNPDDLNQGMLGNAMREVLYGQDDKLMKNVVLDDMRARMLKDAGGSLTQRQVDGLEMFERYYRKVENQIYKGLETQLGVDENLQREVVASLKLNDMATDDAAMRQFLRRRASASVRAAHLHQETERIRATRDDSLIQTWSEAMHYERQSRSMTAENAKLLMGHLVRSQHSVMGLPEEMGADALGALAEQVQAAYGMGISRATETQSMAVAMSNQSAVAALVKEALPVGGSLRVSTSDVASPEYKEEMKAWARGLADRDSSAFAELNEHVRQVLGVGADTDRKSAETLEDAVSSMNREQLDSLYARTHADKAKVFDSNNTFLGYLDKRDLPTAGEGQVHVARVGKSFQAGGFGVDVGLGTGPAIDPAVAHALDRSALGITGDTAVSQTVNAHTAYEYAQGAASRVKGVFATRLEETAAAAEEKAAQRVAAEAVEKSPLLSEGSRRFLKIAGGVAAGVGLMGLLSKPSFDEGDSSQYLASQELQPPPETFYGHQADAYKDYRKSRSLDVQRAMARERKEKYERDLQPRRVSNYKVSITADAAAGAYDPAKSEEAVRNVLQQNVSQPLNMDSQRDDQRRSLHDATYQSALRSYLDR